MIWGKDTQFWLRTALVILAVLLFISIHAVYWPLVVSLIFTFILIPIRDGLRYLVYGICKCRLPENLAIGFSFVILILILACVANVILRPLLYQLNLLAANFNTIVLQMSVLVNHLENDQTHVYIPEQVKQLINEALVKAGNYGVDSITMLSNP